MTEVEIGRVKYTGEANNKRESKLNCALKVLKERFQIEYPEHSLNFADEGADYGADSAAELGYSYYGAKGRSGVAQQFPY